MQSFLQNFVLSPLFFSLFDCPGCPLSCSYQHPRLWLHHPLILQSSGSCLVTACQHFYCSKSVRAVCTSGQLTPSLGLLCFSNCHSLFILRAQHTSYKSQFFDLFLWLCPTHQTTVAASCLFLPRMVPLC